jgi:outer membrane protein OmpA-like peptidoglycan-associated protein
MRHLVTVTIATMALVACAGGQRVKSPDGVGTKADATPGGAPATAAEGGSGETNDFAIRKSDTAGSAHGATPSKIKPTATEAAMKLFVIDTDKGPIEGIVISLTAPDGQKYYTEETDADGYAETLVPVGQKYDLIYLTLGKRDITATVSVSDKPRQNIKLTLNYTRLPPPPKPASGTPAAPRFVLDGVTFDSGKAIIRAESRPRLDRVVEYMAHKKSARIEISGHTDNVGNPSANKTLSEKRAQACREYLVSKGIDESRIDARGYGDELPIAPNTTEEGRQQNRRIEATEL